MAMYIMIVLIPIPVPHLTSVLVALFVAMGPITNRKIISNSPSIYLFKGAYKKCTFRTAVY